MVSTVSLDLGYQPSYMFCCLASFPARKTINPSKYQKPIIQWHSTTSQKTHTFTNDYFCYVLMCIKLLLTSKHIISRFISRLTQTTELVSRLSHSSNKKHHDKDLSWHTAKHNNRPRTKLQQEQFISYLVLPDDHRTLLRRTDNVHHNNLDDTHN